MGVAALTGAAALRSGGRIFFGIGVDPGRAPTPTTASDCGTGEGDVPDATLNRVPWSMATPIAVLVMGALSVGALPSVRAEAARAGALFVDRAGYIRQALFHSHVHVSAFPVANWSAADLGAGLLSSAAAVALAAAAWFGRSLPESVPVMRHATGVMRELRSLHSGRVGDYVAWLFVGIAVLAGLVGLPVR